METNKQLPDFSIEKKLSQYKFIVGLDEAGRGCLAGPVVAAAIYLPRTKFLLSLGINDSKKLNEKKREFIFETLINQFHYSIGIVDNVIIDKINILEASKLAMRICLENIAIKPDALLIDGNFKINSKYPEYPIVKGDSKSLSIAAASIIAKVTRDNLMKTTYNEKFPLYKFFQNKGYGTKEHRSSIVNNGICDIHRLSFLKNVLKTQNELFEKI